MANSTVDDFSDLSELGIDLDSTTTDIFDKAVKHIQLTAGQFSNNVLLKLYAYYKQALEGPCNIPKPNWYDLRTKSKWEAWNGLGDLPSSEAKEMYVKLVLETDPNFDYKTTPEDTWVKVSCLNHNIVESSAKDNILDLIRLNDLEQIENHVKTHEGVVNSLLENGLGLIHYAADCGNTDVLGLLLRYGANVNLTDSDGQTALHYACSCAHIDCIKLLLKAGADRNIKDAEGMTAVDVIDADQILIMELLGS